MWLRFVQLSFYQRVGVILTGLGCAVLVMHTMLMLPKTKERGFAHDALRAAQQRPRVSVPQLSIKAPLPLPSESVQVVHWSGHENEMSITVTGGVTPILDWLYALKTLAWSPTTISLTRVPQGLMLEAVLYQREQQMSALIRPDTDHSFRSLPPPEVERSPSVPTSPPMRACADIQAMTDRVRAVVHTGHPAQTKESFVVLAASSQRIALRDFLHEISLSSQSFTLGYVFKKPAKLRIFEHDRRCLEVEFELLKIPSNPVNWLP